MNTTDGLHIETVSNNKAFKWLENSLLGPHLCFFNVGEQVLRLKFEEKAGLRLKANHTNIREHPSIYVRPSFFNAEVDSRYVYMHVEKFELLSWFDLNCIWTPYSDWGVHSFQLF